MTFLQNMTLKLMTQAAVVASSILVLPGYIRS